MVVIMMNMPGSRDDHYYENSGNDDKVPVDLIGKKFIIVK